MIHKSHSWAYIQRQLPQKDINTPMFIAAAFTKPSHGSNLNVHHLGKWIKKMWCVYIHTYIMELYIYTHNTAQQ